MNTPLKIAVDLDGTISEYPHFFKILIDALRAAGCPVYILTDRPPGTESDVAAQLKDCAVNYDIIKITGDKTAYIMAEGINVLFDDVDSYFLDLPEEVAVFKVRQKYNFDFLNRKWR